MDNEEIIEKQKNISKDKLINIFAIIAIISATFFVTIVALPAPDLWWQLSVGRYFDEYNINLVLCGKYFLKYKTNGKNLCERLFENSKWFCLVETPKEFIFIRNNKENKDVIEKAKNRQLKYPVVD